jgi:hypothetical protein
MSLNNKPIQIAGQSWNEISAKLFYGEKKNDFIKVVANLTYSTLWPISIDFPTKNFVRNFLLGNPFSLSLSNFKSSDKKQAASFIYKVVCP